MPTSIISDPELTLVDNTVPTVAPTRIEFAGQVTLRESRYAPGLYEAFIKLPRTDLFIDGDHVDVILSIHDATILEKVAPYVDISKCHRIQEDGKPYFVTKLQLENITSVCWHCGDVLLGLHTHCDGCPGPGDCDDEGCDCHGR